MQIDVLEARSRLADLIQSVQAGEDVVIPNRGEPVVRLVPTVSTEAARGTLGTGRALITWLDSHPLPAHHRRSPEQIEAGIEEERGGWD